MTDAEFLEMCRLAAGRDTGWQYTDAKLAAIEELESDPRGVVRRLLELHNAVKMERKIKQAIAQRLAEYIGRLESDLRLLPWEKMATFLAQSSPNDTPATDAFVRLWIEVAKQQAETEVQA